MRVLSGIKPSGSVHLGNYVGALRYWVAEQHEDTYYCVVDLHALTMPIDPTALTDLTYECAASLLAVGLDPHRSTLFIQSQISYHTRLCWLLECVASMGELNRMTQYKEKAADQQGNRVGLFTYPVLMASDILLYNTDSVPVGDDQRQHLELARTLAERFNTRYGETFTVPDSQLPRTGARVMDLQNPLKKMSKTDETLTGSIGLFEDPQSIEKKVKRAVTDTDGEMVFDRKKKPGLANLLEIYAALTESTPKEIASRYTQYGPLKSDLSACIIETLRPLRATYDIYCSDRAETLRLFSIGRERANAVAEETYRRAAAAVGLVG